MKSDSIKVLVSTITALSGVGGSYWKMEDRVSKLEQQMAKQEQIKLVQLEISQMRRDEELAELEHKIKLDSLRRKHDIR
jgi:hypothetical protein|tara:strand:+ start:399 stop:635 length:237 start_codon:yes stop_codon:yes gene_type:complete